MGHGEKLYYSIQYTRQCCEMWMFLAAIMVTMIAMGHGNHEVYKDVFSSLIAKHTSITFSAYSTYMYM